MKWNSGKVATSLVAALLVVGVIGWKLKAVSTVYYSTSLPLFSTQLQYWDTAPSPFVSGKISNVAIPDGSSDAEITTVVGPCIFNQFTGSTPAQLGLQYSDVSGQGAGYRVQITTSCNVPGSPVYLNVAEDGGGTGNWWLMSVQLPEWPQGREISTFVRQSGYYPGVTIRLPYMNLEWVVGGATNAYTGKPAFNAGFQDTITLATIDRDAAAVPSAGQITTARWPYSIDLAWPALAGVYQCNLSLNGTYVGSTKGTSYTFGGLTPSTSYNLGIQCLNKHWTPSATTTTVTASTTAVSTQSSQVTPRRTGVSKYAATWGGLGESIDTLSGNLNYSATIASPMIRAAGEVPVNATYNSQLWLGDNTGWKTMSGDVGYGYGWRVMAGAITPVWVNSNTFSHYLFVDATGAEYRLDQYAGGFWKSKEGFYGFYEPATRKLWFPNGTQWEMFCMAGTTEADAGSLYPTTIKTQNGNYLTIQYKAAIGGSLPDTSSRIAKITDVGGERWTFTYNTDAIPHLTSMVSTVPGHSKNFTYSAVAIQKPDGTAVGTFSRLATIALASPVLTTSFEYSTYAEMTRAVFPYGGELQWDHVTFTFANNVRVREVSARRLIKAVGATAAVYNFVRPAGDSAQPMHTALTINDVGAQASKDWTFSQAADYTRGFVTQFDERATASSNPLRRSAFTYALSSPNNMPYTASVTTTLDVGTANQVQTKTEQTLGEWGEMTQQKLYAFNSLTTPINTTTCTYTSSAAAKIYGLLTACSATGGGAYAGQSMPYFVQFSYDGTVAGVTNGTATMHDTQNFGVGYTNRRNMSYARQYGGRGKYIYYNLYGESYRAQEGPKTIDWSYTSTTNWMLPSSSTPNSNSGFQSSFGWNSWYAPTQATGPNGDSVTINWNTQGRKTTETAADGTTVSYSYNDAARQMTVTGIAGGTRTTFDGLGRAVKVEALNTAGGVKTTTETEYAECGCTPMGKTKRVSVPYAPGGTVYWTTMTYDAIGRTISVSQPNNSGTQTSVYAGNAVTMTDAAGRWKKYTSDALGNLVQVTEPNPAGGASYETYYSYNLAGKLLQVQMPRPNPTGGTTTQVRTWTYDSDGYVLTATNPENGTTTYTYNSLKQLETKVDAKGQKVKLYYDGYERVIKTEAYATTSATTPINCETVENYYDQGQYAAGRLTAQKWGHKDLTVCAQGEQWYNFTYAQRGQVLSKTFTAVQTRLDPIANQNTDYTASLPVNYEYSMSKPSSLTKITYPTTYNWVTVFDPQAGDNINRFDTIPGYAYSYGYDSDWRMNGMTYQVNGAGNPVTQVNNVAFNAMDQMTSFRDMSLTATETRSYDQFWRLIGIGGTQTLGYGYSTTADDGKIIAKSINAGAVVENYTYDSLGRLSAASTTGPQWGLSFTYDGFGNRLQQTVTKGSAPASSLAIDPATNRVTSWSYDSNGNATSIPGVGSIAYDYANRITTVQSDTYGYDPGNKRVWKNGKFILWGAEGNRLGTFELVFNQDYIGGGAYTWRLRWNQNATDTYFGGRRVGQLVDRLGSQAAHFPYGEEQSPSGQGDRFATYYRDSTGLDYADQRYHLSSSGRFVTADPSGNNVVPTNPLSWNGYSYVEADPVNSNDPEGLELQRCGDLEIDNGQTLGQVLRSRTDIGLMARILWHEASFSTVSNDPRALDLYYQEKETIALAMLNRYAIANGLLAVYDKEGRRLNNRLQGFGQLGLSLNAIMREAAGQGQSWGIIDSRTGDLTQQNLTNLDAWLNEAVETSDANFTFYGAEGNFKLNARCYQLASAFQSAYKALTGGIRQRARGIVVFWNLSQTSNPGNSDAIGLVDTIGPTRFWGYTQTVPGSGSSSGGLRGGGRPSLPPADRPRGNLR